MRAECIQAVQVAAQRLGKTLTAADMRGLEAKIYEARKQLAKQDINAYRTMTANEQLAKAGELVVNDAIHAAIKKRQRAELTIIARAEKTRVMGEMMASGLTEMEALRRYTAYVSDGRGGVQAMESYANGIAQHAFGKMPSFFQLMQESSFAGIQTSAKNSMDYIKESFGIDSGNPLAKQAWKEVEAVRKQMIEHFNRKGGDVAPLANYRNPQSMYAYSVIRRGGKNGEAFIHDMMQWVDRSEYVNADGTLMSDERLKEFLRQAYITIATDGTNKPPGEGGGASSVANRMKAHRQLHYKSPEAYMAAMQKYGAGNIDDQVRGSIESMASDIALVEKFGPNAIHEFNRSYADAVQSTGKEDQLLSKAFANLSGQRTVRDIAVAHWFGEVRAAMVASRLGSMLLSQFADAGTAQAVTRSLGIPTSELLQWVGRMSDSDARQMARLHGLGMESVLNTVARFAADASSSGFMGKAASVIPTIQGANLWTRAWRQGFGLMLEANLGEMSAKYADWNSLPEGDRKRLSAFGIKESDFAIWKLAKPTEYKGSKILGPDSIEGISTADIIKTLGVKTVAEAEIAKQEAALRLTTFVVEQSHQAVLQPGALSQATIAGERGDWMGEIGKTITQFKSFPMAFTRQMLIERSSFEGAGWNRLMFNAKLLSATTILGGLSLVLGDIANGKDPRQMWDSDDPKVAADFGWKAMVKGGGLGFFGDLADTFKSTSENPYQAAGLLGPVGGYMAGTVLPTVVHGISALATQDEKEVDKFTKYAYDSIKGITPGQNLWFLKGFVHNVLLDDLQEMANPGYKDRARNRAMKNYGQDYWLGMGGETRAPDVGNMVAP